MSSVNAVGEGAQSSLTLLAASVPAKMARPTWKSSSITDIQVQWTVPSYDGGSPVTQYRVRRDDGPSTSFLSDVTTTNLYYDFTGLLNLVLTYIIQVAAENVLGVGEYSDSFDFYAASPPETLTNFIVNTQSTSQILLSWSKPTLIGGWSISGYQMYMQDFYYPSLKLIFDGSNNSATPEHPVISPTISTSKTYQFAVETINWGLVSTQTTIIVRSGSVPAKMTSIPTITSYISPDSVRISFVPSTNNGEYSITSFKIYKDNSINTTLLPLGPHEFTMSGLTQGTSYKIQVSSVNVIGESQLSNSLIFYFAVPPSAPQSLVLTSTKNQVKASWNTPASYNGDYVHGYHLYISDGVGGDPQLVANTEGTSEILSYIFSSDSNGDLLECGNTYTIRITAVNLAGESVPSESSILLGQTPSPPLNLSVEACVPNTKITVSWEPPFDTEWIPIRSYIIILDGVDQTSLSITPDMRQVDLPITSNGAYGTDITLSIKATSDKETGYTSPTLSTTVGSIPNSPTGLVISSRPSKSSLSIAWTTETAIPNNQPTIDYRVYNLNSDDTESLISDTGSGGLALKATLTNLTTGDNYTLVVRAVNFWWESANSNSLQVTIGTKPSAPNPPILSTSTSTSISLIIKTSSDNGGVPISSYTVYYDENQTGVFSSDTITDLSNLVWSHTGFSISALVNVKVTATNFMESDPSNLVTFVVAGVPSTPSTPTQVGVPVVKSDGTISATIAWTAPANQGSSILGYTLYYKITQSSSDYAAQLSSHKLIMK